MYSDLAKSSRREGLSFSQRQLIYRRIIGIENHEFYFLISSKMEHGLTLNKLPARMRPYSVGYTRIVRVLRYGIA